MRTLVLAVVICLAAYRPARSIWASELDEFRRDYPSRAERLKLFYGSLTLQGQESYWQRAGEAPDITELSYWGDNGRYCVECRYGPTAHVSKRRFEGGRSIFCAAPKCSFSIGSEPDGTLVVTDLRRDGAGYKAACTAVLSHARFASAPYSILDAEVADFVTDPAMRLTGITHEVSDGQKVATVTWRVAINDADRGGWFKFLPDSGWVLTGYEIAHRRHGSKFAKPSKQRGEVSYRMDRGFEYPIVDKVRQWGEQPENNGVESSLLESSVARATAGVANKGVFELSHYNLEPVARKRRSAYFWLITVLVTSMAGAIIFRLLASRLQKQ
ncbi:MAG TPA: hypothetical protein VHD36_02490 [Pirellulales bacterium]|nr:hypothetical protein [Pirellulales bacterium]